MCNSSWFILFTKGEKNIFFLVKASILLGSDECSFTLLVKVTKITETNLVSEYLCFLCELPANWSTMVHKHMHMFHPYSMAHLRIICYRTLVAKKQYSVIFEIYTMKRCCFALWNEYVARLTAMETGWAVCIVSFSVSQYSQTCYLINAFKNVKCLFSCCQYAKTAKRCIAPIRFSLYYKRYLFTLS